MSILGVKSIPLMKETNRAWKTVPAFYFADRKRSWASIRQHANSRGYEALINLGSVNLDTAAINIPVYNSADTIRAISTPTALRRTLGDFIPPVSMDGGPHWHKRGGYGGEGKVFHDEGDGGCRYWDQPGWDRQEHIEGPEFRVVTVGEKVVQAARKGARRTKRNGRNDFEYTWIGVEGVKKGGFIPLLKEAVGQIPGGDMSIIGWDMLSSVDGPFIIEANTSPGVNEATANRIAVEVRNLL